MVTKNIPAIETESEKSEKDLTTMKFMQFAYYKNLPGCGMKILGSWESLK